MLNIIINVEQLVAFDVSFYLFTDACQVTVNLQREITITRITIKS